MGRLYDALLRLLPPRFRGRYGDEMRRMHEEEWSETGTAGRLRLCGRAVRDVLWTAIVVRIAGEETARPFATERGVRTAGLGWDLRMAYRGLRRRPGFTLTAVATVGLGIAAATAVFSVVDATVLGGFGLPMEDRLVSLWSTFDRQPGQSFLLSAAEFTDVRTDVRSFEKTGAWSAATLLLEPMGDGPARTVGAAFTVGDIYDLVGARTQIGRLPGAADDVIGGAPVALISHGLWQSAFGGRPDAVDGGMLTIGRQSVAVIGVLVPDSRLPGLDADVWVHSVLDPSSWATNRSGHGLAAMGRLLAGVTISDAEAEIASVQQSWAGRYAGQHSPGIDGHRMGAGPFDERLLGPARRTGALLALASGLLLLLACANVANLLLSRSETRKAEIGLRLALGASSGRVGRPVLVEGLAIGVAGGAIGLILTSLLMPMLLRVAPRTFPGMDAIRIDARAALFTLAVSLLTGLAFTVVPALRAAREDPAVLLRKAGRGRTGSMRGLRVLVAGQLALATTLLAGAVLLARSLGAMQSVDSGFDAGSRIALSLTLPAARYGDSLSIAGFYDGLRQRLSGQAGIGGVAAARVLPLRDALRYENLRREDAVQDQDIISVSVQAASPDYLDVMGIPLLEGRGLSEADRGGGSKVALLNASAARALYPGESAVGKRVRALFTPESFGLITIVGVYDDVRSSGLASAPPAEILLPATQLGSLAGWARNQTLVLRTPGSSATILESVRAAVSQIDPLVAVEAPIALQDVVRNSTSRERFVAMLLSVFSVLALIIAAVGVYGVVAFAVARQRREFAIRGSLGAGRTAIAIGVVRSHAGIAGGGTLLGALLAAATTPVLRGFLFGVNPRDGAVLAGVPILLVVVAIVSALVPAVRAARVPPAEILHESE